MQGQPILLVLHTALFFQSVDVVLTQYLPWGQRAAAKKLSLKSHCEKGAEGYQCHLKELEAGRRPTQSSKAQRGGGVGPTEETGIFLIGEK